MRVDFIPNQKRNWVICLLPMLSIERFLNRIIICVGWLHLKWFFIFDLDSKRMKKLFGKIKNWFKKSSIFEDCWTGKINEDGKYNPVTCKHCPHAESCAEL